MGIIDCGVDAEREGRRNGFKAWAGNAFSKMKVPYDLKCFFFFLYSRRPCGITCVNFSLFIFFLLLDDADDENSASMVLIGK